jgi:hypothetical protein
VRDGDFSCVCRLLDLKLFMNCSFSTVIFEVLTAAKSVGVLFPLYLCNKISSLFVYGVPARITSFLIHSINISTQYY